MALITLKCSDGEFTCEKATLELSPVFAQMFANNMIEAQSRVITLDPEFPWRIAFLAMHWLTESNVTTHIASCDLAEFLHFADMYGVQLLRDFCAAEILRNWGPVEQTFLLNEQYKLGLEAKICEAFFNWSGKTIVYSHISFYQKLWSFRKDIKVVMSFLESNLTDPPADFTSVCDGLVRHRLLLLVPLQKWPSFLLSDTISTAYKYVNNPLWSKATARDIAAHEKLVNDTNASIAWLTNATDIFSQQHHKRRLANAEAPVDAKVAKTS